MADPRTRPSLLAVLSPDLLFRILDRLPDSRDPKALRLASRELLALDDAHRRSLVVLRRESLVGLVRRHVSLERLDLSRCPRVDGRALAEAFAGGAGTLRAVDLSRSCAIRWWVLETLVAACPVLAEVELGHCCELGDREIAALGRARGLRRLGLAMCLGVSDVGLANVAVGCPGLQVLCLKWCMRITDIGIDLLVKKCRGIRSLDISYLKINISYTAVTDVGLCLLLGTLRCLQDAKLVHLSRVSVEGYGRALLTSGYKLKKLKLLAGLRPLISPTIIQMVQSSGCRLRWVDKPFLIK